MTQVQCPNCGGYKTHDDIREETLAPDVAKIRQERTQILNWWFGISFAFLILGIVIGVLSFIFLILSSFMFVPLRWTVIICIITSCLSYYSIHIEERKRETLLKEFVEEYSVGTRHFYQCFICGYEWNWADGELLPEVTVRPNLIEQGHALLEEAARRTRRGAQGLE